MNLISIIVPIYNTEKYLSKCLDSIIAQTYTNWEAILVDDGSPDNCGRICDGYAAKDKRFRVIHQQNGGVSVARQTGLDNATGDYIIHCDPDDWIEPTMLEEMVECAISNDADMVICDFSEETSFGSREIIQDLALSLTSEILLEKIINRKVHGSCCNKLIKNTKCKATWFYPKEITCYEDELFLLRLLKQDLRITYLQKALYHYRINVDSSTTHSPIKKIDSRIIEIAEIESIIDTKEYYGIFETKEELLKLLFENKRLKELTTLYKDIHHKIINRNIKYKFPTPLGYFFTMALKGYPRLAYYLYKANIFAIQIIQTIRGRKSESTLYKQD